MDGPDRRHRRRSAGGRGPVWIVRIVNGAATNNGDLNLLSAGLAMNLPLNAVDAGIVHLVEAGAVPKAAAGIITAGSLSVTDLAGNVVLELANAVGSVAAGTRWR